MRERNKKAGRERERKGGREGGKGRVEELLCVHVQVHVLFIIRKPLGLPM